MGYRGMPRGDIAIFRRHRERYRKGHRKRWSDLKPNPTVLILILADLATDHRCRKIASSLKKLGYHPVILCDRPLGDLGPSWSGLDIRILTRRSHYRGFLKAFLEYLVRVTPILFSTHSPSWIVEDGTPLFWAAWIGRLRGRRVIYDAREILLETPAIRSRPTRRLAWTLWLKAGEALCGPLLTVSPGFERHYRARHPGKLIRLLPNVPEAEKGVPAPGRVATGPVRLIYQGALRAGSGLREVIAAVASTPEYLLDIYGSGPEEETLRSLAAAPGTDGRVRLHGAVPFEALREPLAGAHIGVHLLEPDGLSFDLTLSNKIFDYLHAALPVLLGDTAAHREFLAREPVGAIPSARTPQAIRAALESLLADYAGLADRCRSARARWRWEAFEPNLAEALGPGGGPHSSRALQAAGPG